MNRTSNILGVPAFIADPHSVTLFGTGAQLDFTTFTDATKFGVAGKRKIPAGTVVELNASGVAVFPTGTANTPTYLLRSDAEEDSRVAARSGFGLMTGGNVYETLLPDATGNPRVLTPAFKTALGPRFHFQSYSDIR